MSASPPEAQLLPGRLDRWMGYALLAHFAAICTIKVLTGCGEEILWMSHVGLLMTGVGLVSRSILLVTTALTCILVLHSLWLADCISWWVTGVFPLGIATYLPEADAWIWVATAHHFYLAPLLLVIVLRNRQWPEETLLAAAAVYLFLTVISRAVLTPGANVNYAFGLLTAIDHPLVDLADRVPGSIYLLGLNSFVCTFMFAPVALAGKRRARASC